MNSPSPYPTQYPQMTYSAPFDSQNYRMNDGVDPNALLAAGLTPAQINALSRMNHSVLIRAPPCSDFFKALNGVYLAFFILAALLTVVVTVVCMKMIVEVFIKIKNEYVQVDLYWLLSSPMVVCWICFLGICFPRSSGILYAVGLAMVVMALATTCTLFARLYGGRKGLSEYLLAHNRRMEFAAKPLCCCCSCLPVAIPTVKNVRLFSLLVDQTPFVRIVLAIALLIISMEGSPLNDPGEHNALTHVVTTLNIIGVVSTLTAQYAAHVIMSMSENDLTESGFDLLFKCMNIVQTVYSLQRFILEMIGRYDGFPELPPMTPETISAFWFFVGMIGWYTVISIALAARIRPGRSSFFDDEKHNKSTRTRMHMEPPPQITQIELTDRV